MGMIDRLEQFKQERSCESTVGKKMAQYQVCLPISGRVFVEVLASSEKDALSEAWKVVNSQQEGEIDMEWDFSGEPNASLIQDEKCKTE